MRPSGRVLLGISVVWLPLAFLFDGVTVLFLPVRVGGDATQVGLISFAGLSLAAGLQPVAGWLSDRHRQRIDRRWFLVAAAVPALLGLWLLAGSAGILAAVVGYVVLQVGATAVQAAQQTLVPELVDGGRQGRAAGLKAAFDVGGAFVAFLVLGAVLAGGGIVPAAVVTAAVLVGAVGVMVALVPPTSRSAAASASRLPRGLVRLVVSRFLFLLATYAVGRFLVLLVAERAGVPVESAVADAGWLLALLTLTTAVTAIPFGWAADRWPRRDQMTVGAFLGALGIAVLVPAGGLPGILVGGLLLSLGTAAFVTANWADTTFLVPAGDAGRLMGVANLGTGLAAGAAGLIGPVIDVAGFGAALAIASVAAAGAAVPLFVPSAGRSMPRERPA